MDDFSGDISTTGIYNVQDAPLSISSDFDLDSDWIRVNRFVRHYNYRILTYPGVVQNQEVAVHDLEGNQLWSVDFDRREYRYQHLDATGAAFFAITSSPESGDPTGFNFFIQTVDDTSNVFSSSRELRIDGDNAHFGALERFGDVDLYRVFLYADTTYTFDLKGARSFGENGTTLTDPILRLFGTDQRFIAGDNDSGLGNNSRLTYSPTQDGLHYLRVLGNGNTAGSYAIESDQFDDFAGSIATTGVIVPDGGPVEVRTNFSGDTDWLRVRLEADTRYHVSGARFYQLFDADGAIPEGVEVEFDRFLIRPPYTYTVQETGDYFLQPFDTGIYSVNIETDNAFRGDFPFPAVDESLDSPGETDQWEFEAFNRQAFFVDIVGRGSNPLDGRVEIFSSDGNLRDVFNIGEGRIFRAFHSATISTSPDFKEEFTINVFGNQSDTGEYQLRVTPIDLAGDDESTQFDIILEGNQSAANINNVIETVDDVDFHRLQAQANTWYSIQSDFTVSASPNATILRPDGSTIEHVGEGSFLNPTSFYAPTAGDYFIVVDSSDLQTEVGSYRLLVHDDRPPVSPDQYRSEDRIEVQTELDIVYDGGAIAAGDTALISKAQFDTIQPAAGFEGAGHIFSRINNPNGAVNGWTGELLSGRPDVTPILTPDVLDETLQFQFASALPSYFQGDSNIGTFSALSETEQNFMTTAFRVWSAGASGADARFEPASEATADAPVQVFKAELASGEPFLAFPHGDGMGGDIVINSASPVMQNLQPRTEGYFELLRAVGIVLGLQETDAIGRDQSVLGFVSGSEVDDLPFPSTPLPADYLALNNGVEGNSLSGYAPRYSIVDQAGSYLIIAAPRNFIGDLGPRVLDASGSARSWVLDLRPGQSSYEIQTDGSRPRQFINSYSSLFEQVAGGAGDDIIYANDVTRELYGGAGNDTLHSSSGFNMRLSGNDGNDTYVVNYGTSLVTIDERPTSEAPASGVDTIEWRLPAGFDSIEQDLTFATDSRSLTIRLRLDETRYDAAEQQLIIENMDTASGRVERLVLSNPNGEVATISLPSAFIETAAARFGERRLTLADGSDGFGSLVTLV